MVDQQLTQYRSLQKNTWLFSCELTIKIFCFPCVLFYFEKGNPAWVKNGVCDLAQKIKKHENSHGHLDYRQQLTDQTLKNKINK